MDDHVRRQMNDLVGSHNLTHEMLKLKVSEDHILKIEEFISWEEVGPRLSEITIKEVNENIARDGREQFQCRRKLLQLWLERNGNHATYGALIGAMISAKKVEEATTVCELLEEPRESASASVSGEPLGLSLGQRPHREQQPKNSAMVKDKFIFVMEGVTRYNYISSHMHHENDTKPQLVEHGMETDSGLAPEHNTSSIEANSQLHSSYTDGQTPEVIKNGIESGLQATLTDTNHSPVKECHPHEEEEKDSSTHNSHTDNSEEEKSNSSTSESSLSKLESQSDDKEEMVLKKTTAPQSTITQRMQYLTLDVQKTEKTCEELKQELQQKNDEIIKLKKEKDDTNEKFQSLIEEKESELDTLRSRIAVLEREKDITNANLQDHTHPDSHELHKEVEDLRKKLQQEKNEMKQNGNEIIKFEDKLKTAEQELERADDRYKDELQTIAKEINTIIVEHAEFIKKTAEERLRKAEEELQRAKEKLNLYN